jgi:hypothetical protein
VTVKGGASVRFERIVDILDRVTTAGLQASLTP